MLLQPTHLVLLFLSPMSLAVSSKRCHPTPDVGVLGGYLKRAPLVVHARIIESLQLRPLSRGVPLRQDLEFNVVALITQVLSGGPIPPQIVVQQFVIPAVNSSNGSLKRSFGCLDYLEPNAKFAMMLSPTLNDWTVGDATLPVFALAGPIIPYDGYSNAQILKLLCPSCHAPTVNNLTQNVVQFGSNFRISCIAEGTPIPEVMWFKGPYPIDVVSNGRNIRVDVVQTDDRTRHAILEIEKVVLLDNGDYTCKVSNALGKAQAKLRLRVSTSGVTNSEKENTMDSRNLEPCPNGDNHCFNGGKCFSKKSDSTDRKCSCLDDFMGDQCQFRTSGIVFSTKADGHVSEFWLQMIVQCVLICVFGLIAILLVLIGRYRDQQSRRRKKFNRILRGSDTEVLCKSKSIQVNTVGPPSPPLGGASIEAPAANHLLAKTHKFGSLPSTSASSTPLLPRRPHYDHPASEAFTFERITPSTPESSRRFADNSIIHPRLISTQLPQHLGL